ncbi:MAG: tetratricopeptide repeat protein, partial [Planctomycetota bacterium]|nr:tetratricopeptide repeat protein [Planctomycetota bacterium]
RDHERLASVETQLGRLYADAKEPEVALRWLQAGTRKSPDDVRAHVAVALFHSQQERPEEALPSIETALKLDANGRQTQLLAAIVCRQLADYTTAEKHLQRLFDDNPTDFQVINLLALVLIEQPREADHRRALQLAQMNTQRFPKSNDARATLGWIQLRQGRLDEASKALQGALNQGAASPDTAYYIARRHAKLGETNEALRLLNEALEAPLGRFAYRKQAQALLKQLSDETKSTTGATKTQPKSGK